MRLLGETPHMHIVLNSVLNVKALVGAFSQEKALVGAFSVITNLLVDLLFNLYSLSAIKPRLPGVAV